MSTTPEPEHTDSLSGATTPLPTTGSTPVVLPPPGEGIAVIDRAELTERIPPSGNGLRRVFLVRHHSVGGAITDGLASVVQRIFRSHRPNRSADNSDGFSENIPPSEDGLEGVYLVY